MSSLAERLRSAADASSPRDIIASLTKEGEFRADVVGFSMSLMREGNSDGFLGWIELLGQNRAPVGYIFIERPLKPPHLSAHGNYVVFDCPPEQLHNILGILTSGRAISVRFFNIGDEGSAFLEVS